MGQGCSDPPWEGTAKIRDKGTSFSSVLSSDLGGSKRRQMESLNCWEIYYMDQLFPVLQKSAIRMANIRPNASYQEPDETPIGVVQTRDTCPTQG